MALGDIFKADMDKSITVTGATATAGATATYTAKCNHEDKNCAIIPQLERANVTEGDRGNGDKTATMAINGAGSCYWLPWKDWSAVYGQLGANCDFFVTANLTGCGIIVSGPQNAPHVVHVNCDTSSVDYSAQGYMEDAEAARKQFYGQISEQLVANNVIPSAGLQMLFAEDYCKKMSEGYGATTCVFGVRSGGNWTIYYSAGKAGAGITKQLYPTFESL